MDNLIRVNSAICNFLRKQVNVNNENFHKLLNYIHYIKDEYPATGFRNGCFPRAIGCPVSQWRVFIVTKVKHEIVSSDIHTFTLPLLLLMH